MDSNILTSFTTWYIIFLFSLTLHEAAHALAALLGGDDTAYQGGQVTLNPIPHMRREPFGMIAIPVVIFLVTHGKWMMGWASAPYDPRWGRQFPLRQAAVSAAGPAANLLLVFLPFVLAKILLATGVFVAPDVIHFDHIVEAAAAHRDGFWAGPLATMLSITMNLNLLLFLFNLIPLPPLDGSGILSGLYRGYGRIVEWLQRDFMFSMLGLLIAWQLISVIFKPAASLLLILLHGHVYK